MITRLFKDFITNYCKMIIRNANGDLIKINKYDYANDMIYYEKIMNIKKEFTKEDQYKNNVNKASDFFSQKKINKKTSRSLQSICDFINIKTSF
jgi:hypothetical protein